MIQPPVSTSVSRIESGPQVGAVALVGGQRKAAAHGPLEVIDAQTGYVGAEFHLLEIPAPQLRDLGADENRREQAEAERRADVSSGAYGGDGAVDRRHGFGVWLIPDVTRELRSGV